MSLQRGHRNQLTFRFIGEFAVLQKKMLFVIAMYFFMAASCQAQIPRSGHCPESKINASKYDPRMVLGQWYVYESYPSCDPPARCKRVELIDEHEGRYIETVKLLSAAPDTFDVYETVNLLRYENNGTFLLSQSHGNGRFVGQYLHFVSTDYSSYLLKAGCQEFGDSSLHFVWVLTRSPHPSPSVIAEINEAIRLQGISAQFLEHVNQTNCPAEY